MMNIETLLYIAEKLNKTKATWGIGGSLLLFQHGIVDAVNDLDIIVENASVETVVSELRNIGQEREVHPLPPFQTTYYHEFKVKDLSMDIMGEFKIEHEEGVFVLPFTENSIENYKLSGVDVPFCHLEDWYILYQLIPGREEKVKKIEQYFIESDSRNEDALRKALKGNLPERVRNRIQNILVQCGL